MVRKQNCESEPPNSTDLTEGQHSGNDCFCLLVALVLVLQPLSFVAGNRRQMAAYMSTTAGQSSPAMWSAARTGLGPRGLGAGDTNSTRGHPAKCLFVDARLRRCLVIPSPATSYYICYPDQAIRPNAPDALDADP